MISLKRKKEKMLIFADRQSVTEVSLSHYKYVYDIVCMYSCVIQSFCMPTCGLDSAVKLKVCSGYFRYVMQSVLPFPLLTRF